MIQSHVFLSVPKQFSANFGSMHQCWAYCWAYLLNCAGHASMLTCYHRLSKAIVLTIAVKLFGMLHYTLIPFHCIQVDIERLLFTQFLRSKNRQKGNQFFYQTSDFCENCNPHSSYHTTAVGECLVNIWFAETCKLTLFTFLKIFIGLKHGSLLHAQTGSLSMQFCM